MTQPPPDDTEIDEMIRTSGSLAEALWEISEKYDTCSMTANYPRWKDGKYLRSAHEYIGEIYDAIARFPEDTQRIVDHWRDGTWK